MNPREVFERNPDFTGREEQFKLRPYEWEFYLRLDGRRTVLEIGESRKLDPAWVAIVIERLQKQELIRVVEISMDEFYRRFVNDPVSDAAIVPTPELASLPASATIPVAAGAKRLSFSLRRGENPTAHPPEPLPVPPAPMVSVPAPVSVPVSTVEELHLKPLLDFIVGQSGGSTVGQLAAYRVFLKVPNELLRQAGIKSLNLVGADFTIRDPALKSCLLAAVEEILGKPYTPAAPARAVAAPSAAELVPA